MQQRALVTYNHAGSGVKIEELREVVPRNKIRWYCQSKARNPHNLRIEALAQ